MSYGAPNFAAVRRAPAPSGKRYRCFYSPLDRDGFPVAMETGVLPFVELKADGAEDAQRKAFKKLGFPVAGVERLEGHAS